MLANPQRGEVLVELGELKFIARPDFDAVIKIEENTGKTILKLTMHADQGNLTAADALIIFEAAGQGVTSDQLKEAAMSVGSVVFVTAAVPVLLMVFAGSKNTTEEPKKKTVSAPRKSRSKST